MADKKFKYIFDLIVGKNGLKKTFDATIKSAKKLSKELPTVGKQFDKLSKVATVKLGDMNRRFKSLIRRVNEWGTRLWGTRKALFSIQAILIGIGATLFFRRAIKEAAEMEDQLIGLQSIAETFGESAEKMTQTVKELSADGMIPLADVSRSLKNLLATGVGADLAIKAFKGLRDSAAFNRQGQLELGAAVAKAAEGIKNQLSINVDNAGITKNLSVLQKEYAAEVGKSVGTLTEYEKQLANVTGVIREAGFFQNDYNLLFTTFSGVMTRLKGQWKFFLAEVGEFVTKSPTIIKLIGGISDGLIILRKAIEDEKVGEKWIRGIINGLAQFIDIITMISKGIVDMLGILRLIPTWFMKTFRRIGESTLQWFEKLAGKMAFWINKIANNKLVKMSFLEGPLKEAQKSLHGIQQTLFESHASLNETAKKDEAWMKNRALQFAKWSEDIENTGTNLSNFLRSFATGVTPPRQKPPKTKVEIGDKEKFEDFDPIRKLTVSWENFVEVIKTKEVDTLKILKDGYNKQTEAAIAHNERVGTTFIDKAKFIVGEISKTFDDKEAMKKIKTSFFEGFLQGGEEGARNALTGTVTAIGNFFAKGLGDALGPVFEMFTQTPEQFRESITEFIKSIPRLLINVLQNMADLGLILTEAIIAAIEELANNLDVIIVRLVDSLINNLPRIVSAIIRAIPRITRALISAIPKIIQGFINSFVKELPRLIEEIARGIRDMFKDMAFGGALGGGGGGGGGFLGDIPVIGGLFAKGGEVPAGFPNDSYPARLTSGEYVIDRSLTQELKTYLATTNTMNQMLMELRQPQIASATVTLNEREFANIILKLNRTNQRLA